MKQRQPLLTIHNRQPLKIIYIREFSQSVQSELNEKKSKSEKSRSVGSALSILSIGLHLPNREVSVKYPFDFELKHERKDYGMGSRRRGKGRRKVGRKKRKMRSKIRHRK